MRILPAAFVLAAFLPACSGTQYYFAPRPRTDLTPAGMYGATYGAPGTQKDSSLRILPLGIRREGGRTVLPVRYYLENNGADVWRLEPGRQKVSLPNAREVVGEARSTSFEGKITEVPKGVVRIWDLEFPMPPEFSHSPDLNQFELAWEIGAPFPFAGRTKFVPTPMPDQDLLTNPAKGKSTNRGKADFAP